ncbi:aminotransferase class III-fold pyridoxal phosphate-dependent enzyme [Pseudoalteromonas denitrificans]|uniref:Aminotransferase MxcL n=1 Tax=Pseudoalteromonas denitrificans DSM 6059 TaxID=1123010 RepID=A0A1I1ELF3_9GAMM|nr:aminotransferase class III-fold pyridoxal phosphate-dependent enzyme [Pseudoalteromonas denitrificans]SFB87462.1 aminotransferase MxcL [Pseudoalteromonas denitrificans DSM 6059]
MNNPNELNITQSQLLEKEGSKYIAGFTQTMMKKPEQFAQGQFPVYIEEGQGSHVTDVDGNEYIDFICGLAANTLGHNHPVVVNAIQNNLKKGLIHSLPTPVEIKTAKTLVDMIPGAEKARFFKTGADANSAAIRLARYLTKKEEIVTIGYNGWHDQYMFDTPGVPKNIENYTHRMPLFTPMDEPKILELIDSKKDQLAAVLLSVPYNRTLTSEFLKLVRQACDETGVLLILDEVVTGFRLALGGAQEYFGVKADLVTLSKGIAAGMPLSAVVGSDKLMSQMEALQVSTTFGGEMLSLEVCDAVLKEYQNTDYIDRIARLGAILKAEVNAISSRLETPLEVVGYDAIPMFLFAKNPLEHVKLAEPFLAEMAKRGVLLRREVNFISGAHTLDDINTTITAIQASLSAMKAQGLFENNPEAVPA